MPKQRPLADVDLEHTGSLAPGVPANVVGRRAHAGYGRSQLSPQRVLAVRLWGEPCRHAALDDHRDGRAVQRLPCTVPCRPTRRNSGLSFSPATLIYVCTAHRQVVAFVLTRYLWPLPRRPGWFWNAARSVPRPQAQTSSRPRRAQSGRST